MNNSIQQGKCNLTGTNALLKMTTSTPKIALSKVQQLLCPIWCNMCKLGTTLKLCVPHNVYNSVQPCSLTYFHAFALLNVGQTLLYRSPQCTHHREKRDGRGGQYLGATSIDTFCVMGSCFPSRKPYIYRAAPMGFSFNLCQSAKIKHWVYRDHLDRDTTERSSCMKTPLIKCAVSW